MYFIFEIDFYSNKSYIADLIKSYIKKENMSVYVLQTADKIMMVFNENDERRKSFLLELEKIIPASLFLGKGKHYFSKDKPKLMPINTVNLPLNIAPCPSCQKEMFDVSSKRYYYPFTSCNHCGGQRAFLMKYPFNRPNTSMKFISPCKGCEDEIKTNSFRLNYPLISCIECGIVIRILDKENEHLALTKGDLRKLFEVSSNAIADGKKVLMKTTNGYRMFFKSNIKNAPYPSTVLMTNANTLNKHLMMINQEFNSLLSIERPLLRVATKSDELKEIYGSSILAKYPDDGMTMLLARELMNISLDYVSYIQCDENEKADILVDFDMPINTQEDTKIFINRDKTLFISGERILFPTKIKNKNKKTIIAHNLACTKIKDDYIIDSLEVFNLKDIKNTYILETDKAKDDYPKKYHFKQYQASMMSVLAEYGKTETKSIGVHFDGQLNFLYYNGKRITNIIPPREFESDNLWEKISTLREGSDRLVDNYKKAYPKIWERLDNLQGNIDIFEVSAIALRIKNESFEGISAEALSFKGKGGLQIDTQIKDQQFDNYAFLTSIMSYQLGDVPTDYMCYSIYESFGDYIGEVVYKLARKMDTKIVTLTGETFANQSLYARLSRTLNQYTVLMNKNIPIGKENAIYGALYL